jgi:lysophospholipase L1-like esterase
MHARIGAVGTLAACLLSGDDIVVTGDEGLTVPLIAGRHAGVVRETGRQVATALGETSVAPGAALPAARHTVWLRVPDVKGSYTIPYIQSSPDLEIRTVFSDPASARARVQLLRDGVAVGTAVETTPAAPLARFRALPPAEYAARVVGIAADGRTVLEDCYQHIAIGTVLAALGDSITEGYHSQGFWRDSLELTPADFPAEVVSRDRRNFPQYAPTTAHHRPEVNCFASWMPRLNDLLAERWRRPVFIANEGWGGFTTGHYLGLLRDPGWQARMRLLRPTAWLIHLGVNDERHQVPAADVAANLAAMVSILLTDYGADPARICISQPCYDYAPGAAALLTAYGREIDSLVAAKGLRPGPDFFTAYSTGRETYYGADPVHPNLAGMKLMAELWAEALSR